MRPLATKNEKAARIKRRLNDSQRSRIDVQVFVCSRDCWNHSAINCKEAPIEQVTLVSWQRLEILEARNGHIDELPESRRELFLAVGGAGRSCIACVYHKVFVLNEVEECSNEGSILFLMYVFVTN